MRGSIDWQVREVFSVLNDIGKSKHESKAEAREAGAKTWADMGKALNCHSYSTYDDYRAVAKDVFNYVKSEFGVKDIMRIESYQVSSWMMDKIQNGGRTGDGVERSSFDKYAAAISKFEKALNQYSAEKNIEGKTIKFDLKEVRQYASKELGKRNNVSRAYRSPTKVVEGTAGKYNLLASIQRESGARIDEVSRLHKDMFKGVWADKHSGVQKGWIQVSGKGGKERLIGSSPETYQRALNAIAAEANAKGVYRTNEGNYREKLKEAAAASGQKYEGSHGLRWNWAQERHAELQTLGLSYEASLTVVSQEMGHERSDITCHYLH